MSDVGAISSKRVLVTGGAGFIGSHLVDALAALDPPALVVADNFFLGKEENLAEARRRHQALAVEKVDVADFEAIGRVVDTHGVQVIFDLATVPLPYSLVEPADTVRQNVGMAVALCELAREGRFETLIYFSSSEVYGTAQAVPMTEEHPIAPLTPYAASKAAADHIVSSYRATFAIDAAIVRPFNNFGPRQNEGSYAGLIPIVIRRALAGLPTMVHGDGRQTRDFIFVEDTVAGALAVYDSPGTRQGAVNLASGLEVSVNEVVAAIYDVMGLEPMSDYVAERPGDVRRHCGSAARAASLFGFAPGTSLHDGLAATVAWYRSTAAR